MVLDEHLLALCNQRLSRTRVQVQVDAVLLVLQARLGLFHVLGHAVAGEELLRLGLVVRLGRLDERRLERRPVHFEVLPVRVGFVQAERDCSDGRLSAHAGQRERERDDSPNESITFLTRSVSIVSPFLCFSINLRTADVSLLLPPLCSSE